MQKIIIVENPSKQFSHHKIEAHYENFHLVYYSYFGSFLSNLCYYPERKVIDLNFRSVLLEFCLYCALTYTSLCRSLDYLLKYRILFEIIITWMNFNFQISFCRSATLLYATKLHQILCLVNIHI